MPMNLQKLIAKTAKAAIDFGDGDVLHVEYYPARITSRMLMQIAAFDSLASLPDSEAMQVLDNSTELLLALLASWDFVTGPIGREKPLPLDEAHLKPLGLAIQWPILLGIVRAMNGTTVGEAEALEVATTG